MIKMICDKCNCEADYFSTRLLNQKEVDKLSVQYNTEFKSKLVIDKYICPSCGDMKESIHILYG